MINLNFGKYPGRLKRNFRSAYLSCKTGRIINVLNVPKDFKSRYTIQKVLHGLSFMIAIVFSGILLNSCHLPNPFSKKNIEVEIAFFQADKYVNIILKDFKQSADSDLVLNIDRDNNYLDSKTIRQSTTRIDLSQGTYKFSLSFSNPEDKPEIIYKNRVDTVDFFIPSTPILTQPEKVKIKEIQTQSNSQTKKWKITILATSPNAPIEYSIDDGLHYQTSNIFDRVDTVMYIKILVKDGVGTTDFRDERLGGIQGPIVTPPSIQEIETCLASLRQARINGSDDTPIYTKFGKYFEKSATVSWSSKDIDKNYSDLISAISSDTLNLKVVGGSVRYSTDKKIIHIVLEKFNSTAKK